MMGSKLYVRLEKALLLKCLHIKYLLKFAAKNLNKNNYLPADEYNKEPNRECPCNLLNTLIDEEFQDFIRDKIKIRKHELIESENRWYIISLNLLYILRNLKLYHRWKENHNFLIRMQRDSKEKMTIKI